jgi:hypothetical protein
MYILELTLEAYEALSEHVPNYSILVSVWRDVIVIFDDGEKATALKLACDEAQIEVLLALAHSHYPPALSAIQEAINRSRS